MRVFSRSRLLLMTAVVGCIAWSSGAIAEAGHGSCGSWGGSGHHVRSGGGSWGGSFGRHHRHRHHRRHVGHGSYGQTMHHAHHPAVVSHGSFGTTGAYGYQSGGKAYQDQGYDAAPPAPPQQSYSAERQPIPDAPPAPPAPEGQTEPQRQADSARDDVEDSEDENAL